jgi:hypothetical protein
MTDSEKIKAFDELNSIADQIKAEQLKMASYNEAMKHFANLRKEAGDHLEQLYIELNNHVVKQLLDGDRSVFDVLFH